MRPQSRPAAVAPTSVVLAAFALAGVCGLTACNKTASPAAAPSTRQPLTVSVAPVREARLRGGLTASGLLIPEVEAVVSTELNGYRVSKVYVDQGAQVKAGQPLAQLDDALLKTTIAQQQAVVAQQQVAAERAEAEAQRVAGLDNLGVLPEEQIVERRLSARSGHASVAAAVAQLNDLDTREAMMTVRAPVSGLVLQRMVRPGDVASPSTPMFRIAADDIIELNAEVPEDDLGQIKAGDPAQVSLPSGEVVAGRVRVVSPEIDQQTKLGHVRITLPQRADLRPGGYGQAVFGSSGSRAIVVPESALRFDADGASVMTLGAGNRVHRVPVTTGDRAGGLVQILTGPAPGTLVLLGGGAFVLDGDTIRPERVETPAGSAAP